MYELQFRFSWAIGIFVETFCGIDGTARYSEATIFLIVMQGRSSLTSLGRHL